MFSALSVGATEENRFNHAAAGQWIEDGRNGRLAADTRIASFVAAALTLGQAGPLRAAIGQAARLSALDMSWASVIGRFEANLRQLAEPLLPYPPVPAQAA